MNDIFKLVTPLIAGVLLGGFFFGGLWWTVKKGLLSKQPALWLISSLVLRTGIVLSGFYFVMHDHWERLLVCITGFVIARFIVMRLTDAQDDPRKNLKKEVSHAS